MRRVQGEAPLHRTSELYSAVLGRPRSCNTASANIRDSLCRDLEITALADSPKVEAVGAVPTLTLLATSPSSLLPVGKAFSPDDFCLPVSTSGSSPACV